MNSTVVKELNIRELQAVEFEAAAHLLGRGMRDNPNNVQAFRCEPAYRERALAKMFLPVLRRTHAKGNVFGAFDKGKMVAVCAMTAPGQCQVNTCEKLRTIPAIFCGKSSQYTTAHFALGWRVVTTRSRRTPLAFGASSGRLPPARSGNWPCHDG